ncbi:MAG: PEP/pyruvate-binding domain-containing protein, partial [Nannocystaceae bacterium]|nr:PEP/pyruvate-binding domain-containing protein [Nannocystaceae bacterium]
LALMTSCSNDGGGSDERVWECVVPESGDVDFTDEVGCEADFALVASPPLDATTPGALSVKTVLDRFDDNALHYQNSQRYQVHYDFVSTNLSGDGLPIVGSLADFNSTEYYSPSRRFALGAVTFYEDPAIWTYEISPYDTASADLIAEAYYAIEASSFFGQELYFHPTSEAVEREAANLPDDVRVITSDELYEGIDYQPLNLAESLGRLRIMTAEDLETEYVTFRDIVVLDEVPNDISVVLGIITAEFQTPLSHINVLSQNRGTPNMGLREAHSNEELLALDGKWVRLDVNALEYEVEEVTQAEADAWWDEHKPGMVGVPSIDDSVTDLRDVKDIIDESLPLVDAVKAGIPAFGGKASHYGALARIEDMPAPKAFSVPIFYYLQFIEQNGFDTRIEEMIADPSFADDPAVRDSMLEQLRADMEVAPVDPEFEALLMDKLATEYSGVRMRFRSSTNAEDLEGFTGAGLYTSKSGDPSDPSRPVLDAVRTVWASVWGFRAFEERTYRSIDHTSVGMALLVHRSFPDEEANGVALTANPFDLAGIEPGFYINVQYGEASVVQPDSGTSTDQFVHHYDLQGQPVVYITHSNITPGGAPVLSASQINELSQKLADIRAGFMEAYGPPADDPTAWYAMDVEFKFDGEPGEEPALFIKQARPHPGWGQ